MSAKSITFSNEEYLNFELIGINSREKDFRLAWFLNREMKWSLERKKPHKLETKEQNSEHELFQFISEENHYTVHLISNRSLQGVLVPEYAQIEYLLKVINPDALLRGVFPLAQGGTAVGTGLNRRFERGQHWLRKCLDNVARPFAE
ncbi:MAG: IPExxxVDY family protein [Sediminibacterium sp.]